MSADARNESQANGASRGGFARRPSFEKFRSKAIPILAFACVAHTGFAAEAAAPVGGVFDKPVWPGRAAPGNLYLPDSRAALIAQQDRTGAAPMADVRLDGTVAIEANKSYWIPAAEIVGFDVLLNLADRTIIGNEYKSNLASIKHNLHSSWVVDDDPFRTNQLGHPYQGSMYHGFARSAGLSYWEAVGYTFAGSVFWEIAGETTTPSRNDQVNSGIGGSFLGEALFRMSHLALESEKGSPFWREMGAAAISPPVGFNRNAMGDRFRAVFYSHNPAYFSRLQIGVAGATQSDPGVSLRDLHRNELQADFSMEYGLPGKPGYSYDRPFDYFNFQATASSANVVENVIVRGLLIGKDYGGDIYRGVWGLYGNYDYFSPQTFRISTTGLALGTSGQLWLTKDVALQTTGLLGAGYAAVGTINSVNDRDYHYGATPEALLALRLNFGDTASFDMTGREYFVSRVGASSSGRRDTISRADSTLTFRVHNKHAVAVKYLWTLRQANYPGLGDRTQRRGSFGLFYTYLGSEKFGSVEWR